MSPPWMPLYIADYLRDTTHLRGLESGAYLHLIMAYWVGGKLPDNDRQLATITKLTLAEWRRVRPVVEPFFHDGWKHKRVDAELARAADISSKRRASAEQRHGKRDAIAPANGHANAHRLDTHARGSSPSQSHTQELEEAPELPIDKILADASGGRKPTRPSIDGFFDQFWKVYPKRGDAANPKKPARDKFERALKTGADPAQIIAAAQRYCDIESSAGRSNTEKIAQAVTWLSQQRWQDYPQAVPAGVPIPPDPSMPSDAELRARHAKRIPDDPKPEDASLFREGDGAYSADEEALRH